uniref:Guanylate kinase-like domain-containing protein n=1 Tax=Pygocentrus nattereri TaxID=42514 RepID=A0AAR2KQ77_PYGNA
MFPGGRGHLISLAIVFSQRQNLKNVSILCHYVHLQKLELPYNRIKDLSCVSHMPYLIMLDASHNELSEFFGFQPPKNLKEVNFSHNQISAMKDLSAYASLSKLILDCILLNEVSSTMNSCTMCKALGVLHLGNLIKKIENLHTLRTLQVLDLSSNRIQSLSGLQNLHFLGSINLESNLIREIKEATYVHDLPLLRELNLKRSPVQEQPDYRLAVIFLLHRLTHLDEQAVTAEEKVSAVNKFDPPLEVGAARDHMTHVVYQHMQPQVIFDSTLPSLDAPYPMLILTGPQACGKRELAHKLCQEFSDYFAYGACHTTRGPYFGEEDGCDYHFVLEEEFQNMIRMGCFVQTMQYGGHWYGLSREAIESAAREGLACCIHMELEGVFSLKNSYFEPRYVLLIPTSTKEYISRMKARGLYSNGQIDTAVSRINLYVKINKERPGFFDSVISSGTNLDQVKCTKVRDRLSFIEFPVKTTIKYKLFIFSKKKKKKAKYKYNNCFFSIYRFNYLPLLHLSFFSGDSLSVFPQLQMRFFLISDTSFQTHSAEWVSQWKDGQKHLWMFSDLKQLDLLLSLRDQSFKCCLSDGGSFGICKALHGC